MGEMGTSNCTEMGVSRRSFVKGGAVLMGGLAAAGAFAGCAPAGGDLPQTGADDATWDKECDVVVVGTGTVANAALAASNYGAESVVVLEKKDTFGGTTAFSGQGMGIPLTRIHAEAGARDSLEDVLEYYRNASGGRADLTVGEAYATNGDKYLQWLEDEFGCTIGFLPLGREFYGDYYEPNAGYLGVGRNPVCVTAIDGEPEGTTQWQWLEKTLKADEKVELMMGCPATQLVTDASGAVVGVVAEDGGKEIRIKANKGVVLGTGGFEHNPEMRTKHLSYPLLALQSCDGNTGDGQTMGMRIGADVAYMDRCWGLPHVYVGSEDPKKLLEEGQAIVALGGTDAAQDGGTYRGLPGSVIVNAKGRRFGNECAAYDNFNRGFGIFDSDTNTMSGVAYLIFDSTYVPAFGTLAGQAEDGSLPAAYVQADTLEGLAEALGIDVEGFTDEMEAFNANAREGRDPRFHRGEHEFDLNTTVGYMKMGGIEVTDPNPVLRPLEKAPFFGVPYVSGTFGTNGGLRIDEHSQVLNVDGDPIGGLYAVGNCSSGVAGAIYAHGGMTVGSGSVMSWVAVRHMLGVE